MGFYMRVKKGDFGYISYKKKRNILFALAMILIGIVIFVVGLLLNKMSNRNIFTVIAMLFSLPFSKFLVGLIVLFPYASVDREKYERVKKVLPDNMELMTDLVVTSSEKVMHLDFIAVGNGQVIGLIGKRGQELGYIRKYLSDGVHNWGSGYNVKIVEGEKIFLQELQRQSAKSKPDVEENMEASKEEERNVKSYLRSLIV